MAVTRRHLRRLALGLGLRGGTLASVALGLGLHGCTLASDFAIDRTAETSDPLCSDGLDNDADGLADCQDWSCLDQRVCCTIPAVVVGEDFDGLACYRASCDEPEPGCALDAGKWQTWGSPKPVICDGALWPNKLEGACYVVGALSVAAVALEPGLAVVAGVAGQPELKGELIVGLTFQETITGSNDACLPVDTLVSAFDVTIKAASGGARAVAHYEGIEVGSSPVYTGEERHIVRLSIGDDRLIHYAFDGQEFAISPSQWPLPHDRIMRVGLAGKGLAGHFEDVQVTSTAQCDDPGSWAPAPTFVALAGDGRFTESWDGQQVIHPFLAEDAEGVLNLYYTGCDDVGTCRDSESVGRALARPGYPFVRDEANPLAEAMGSLGLNPDLELAVLLGTRRLAYAGNSVDGNRLLTWALDELGRPEVSSDVQALTLGATGEWDDGVICCASPVEREDGILLWYGGRRAGDTVWQIGLATSEDGRVFVKSPSNPVVTPGTGEAFDRYGVLDPSVVYDEGRGLYRMWYAGRGSFGEMGLGYAVSVDGSRWQKYPGNPVVPPKALELDTLGSPTVVSDDGRLYLLVEGKRKVEQAWSIFALENLGRARGDASE